MKPKLFKLNDENLKECYIVAADVVEAVEEFVVQFGARSKVAIQEIERPLFGVMEYENEDAPEFDDGERQPLSAVRRSA